VQGATDPTRNTASDPAEWVARHGDALYRYAVVRVREPDVAEDLVQETFLAGLNARERFAAAASERTWLIAILRRKIVDLIRRRIRERQGDEPSPSEESTAEFFQANGLWQGRLAPWSDDPGALSENREFWEVFYRCVDGLPANLADAFLLRELARMEGQEVCKVLNLTPTNLWARLHRARLGLRRCLEANWFAGRPRAR
jgi:RNA polymerase sigma-70 factor (ECF subfamily)